MNTFCIYFYFYLLKYFKCKSMFTFHEIYPTLCRLIIWIIITSLGVGRSFYHVNHVYDLLPALNSMRLCYLNLIEQPISCLIQTFYACRMWLEAFVVLNLSCRKAKKVNSNDQHYQEPQHEPLLKTLLKQTFNLKTQYVMTDNFSDTNHNNTNHSGK